ncbi:MAG: hypothetical protein ACPK85_00080 [Methanosarcina sp.]
MSKQTTLKILTVYFLISCFLVSNLAYTASSEANPETFGNNTDASGNIETENPGSAETGSSQPPGTESQGNQEINSPENIDEESPDSESLIAPDDAENKLSEDTGVETPEETQSPKEEETENSGETDNPQTEDTEPGDADKNLKEINAIPENLENGGTQFEGTAFTYENESQESVEIETLDKTETGDAVSTEIEASGDMDKTTQPEPFLDEKETKSSSHGNSGDSGYRIIKKKPPVKNEAVPPEPTPTPEASKAPQQTPPSASVNLHGEKTDVIAGEDILLKLSAVNLITKPPMHVQVIIIPPSGMSVSSSEFVQSGAGQYTTTYELDPGQGRDIEVRIESYQPGEFNVKGRVVYYFGGNIKNAEDYTLELPITVRDKSYISEEEVPGFRLVNAIFVVLGVFILGRYKI